MDLITEYPKAALAHHNGVLGPRDWELRHAVYGLTTEAGEVADVFKKAFVYRQPVDLAKLRGEIGDCLWYANVMALVMGFSLAIPDVLDCGDGNPSDFEQSMTLCTTAAAIASVVTLAVDVEDSDEELLVDDLPEHFVTFMGVLWMIAERYGITLEDAADANVAKLQTRFKDGFSLAASQARDAEAEENAMSAAGATIQ